MGNTGEEHTKRHKPPVTDYGRGTIVHNTVATLHGDRRGLRLSSTLSNVQNRGITTLYT